MTRGGKPPKNPRLGALGTRLREVRLAAGWRSGNAFAKHLGWQQSRLSLIEAGRQTPTEQDITEWVAGAGASDEVRAELAALHFRATTLSLRVEDAARFEGGLLGQIEEIRQLEVASALVAEYQQVVVPAMAQTEAYAREFLTQPDRPTRAGVSDASAVAAKRAGRQAGVLDGHHEVVVAVNEAALWARRSAPLDVHLDQLAHLADMAGRVELLVEPLEDMAASLGGFELLDDVVLLESIDGTHIVSEPQAVERFRRALGAIRRRSLVGRRAASRVREIAEQLHR